MRGNIHLQMGSVRWDVGSDFQIAEFSWTVDNLLITRRFWASLWRALTICRTLSKTWWRNKNKNQPQQWLKRHVCFQRSQATIIVCKWARNISYKHPRIWYFHERSKHMTNRLQILLDKFLRAQFKRSKRLLLSLRDVKGYEVKNFLTNAMSVTLPPYVTQRRSQWSFRP